MLAKTHESKVVSVAPETRVADVADEMDAHGVGCVVVVDDEDRPLGIVTDRDLVLRVVATDRDPAKTRASDVMSTDLLVGGRRDSVVDLLKKLEARRVRRAPLVEGDRVVGLISLDDLVVDLSAQLWNLSEAVRKELRDTRRETGARRRREGRRDALEGLFADLNEMGEQLRDRAERAWRDVESRLGRRSD